MAGKIEVQGRVRIGQQLFGLLLRGSLSFRRRLRLFWLRVLLGSLGRDTAVATGVVIQGHAHIRVGAECAINDRVVLQCGPGGALRIGDGVTLSFGCVVMAGSYPVDRRGFDRREHHYREVVIEDEAWVGANATILPGVTIGRASLVAAGAVVIRDVPPGCVVAGVPARVVRRFEAA